MNEPESYPSCCQLKPRNDRSKQAAGRALLQLRRQRLGLSVEARRQEQASRRGQAGLRPGQWEHD